MALPERLLLGPGPSNVAPEVMATLGSNLCGHLDPSFITLMDELTAKLKTVFKTKNDLTIAISGTGSAGMEASVVNFVSAGDEVVVGINGVFGGRIAEMVKRQKGRVHEVKVPWGKALDPQEIIEKAKDVNAKAIYIIHGETSTGVVNDVKTIGENKGDSLLIMDCVTSLAGIPVETDAWGVDVAYSGTQKCLSAPPGLSPFTASDYARSMMVKNPSSWYLDLDLISQYSMPNSQRRYHHTAPVPMLSCLDKALDLLLEEGLENSWKRHQETAEFAWSELEKIGFELLVEKNDRLYPLTTVVLPEVIRENEANIRRALLDDYGIEVGGGLGELSGKIWRIGLMGYNAKAKNVLTLVGAIKKVGGL